MNPQFKTYDLVQLLETEATRQNAEVKEDCQSWTMELPAETGSGILKVYDFEDGLQLLLFEGRLEETVIWSFQSSKPSPVFLFFSTKGKPAVQFGKNASQIELAPLQTVLAEHPPGKLASIQIQAGTETVFAVLSIQRKLYEHHKHCFSSQASQEFSAIFSGETSIKTFRNTEYGLDTAGLVQQILSDDHQGLPHTTFIEAKALEIFSLQLRRWEFEVSNQGNHSNHHSDDVAKVIQARNLLVHNLKDAPTIPELAKRSAVNQQKLKQLFKCVFSKTINQYLREERLKTARHLLAADGMSIREVAAQVGYENPSYFARRFKEMFGVYPSDFLEALKNGEEEN